jgi:hypothetical protein
MIMRKLLLSLTIVMAVTVLVGTSSAYAIDKAVISAQFNPQAIQIVSNGYVDVIYEDTTGEYTFATGPLHSTPFTDILYFAPATGYDTVRSLDSATDYTGSSFAGTPLGAPAIVTTATSVEFTWNVNNAGDVYTIKQLIQISGTTEADTNVRVTTTVTNNGQTTANVAIRHFWDYQIDGDDGPLYAERNPDSAFSFLEIDYMPPAHDWAAIDDNVGDPTQTAAVADRADQVREVYGRWPSMSGTSYAYASTPGDNADSDSAVLFYSKDYSLAPGQSAEFWTALAPTETDPTGEPEPVVGGEFLPIDSTAMLMAGMSANLSILVPIAAGIAGVGAYYIRSRRNKE